ncbi:MAG: prepilin-type N-terminal cleavage/methylation domain-containing protein [Candidatus Hydrogenedentes bacterium]|nr:prepilin-type N-terminal cleavage/methylation domain-containing protein [Candidatus Hydrogenedentota bacterium]
MNEGSEGNKFGGADDVERERVNAPKRHSAGFTLVELLVVIAIVALVAGIAVPGMARLIGRGKDDVSNAARDVYTMLRSANIYASTFRVNTAVVYAVNAKPDSVSGDTVLYIDGVGMARRVYEHELADDQQRRFNGSTPLFSSRPISTDPNDLTNRRNDPAKTRAYIVLSNPEGQMHLLPRYAGVLQSTDSGAASFSSSMNETGMYSIELYEKTADGLYDKISPETSARPGTAFQGDTLEGDIVLDAAFPAHVFTPTGVMEPQNLLKSRWVLHIGPSPDADPEERFLTPDYDAEAGGVPMSPTNIELYPATGRVKIAS